MAALGIESGSVDNRSFSSSTGFAKKFKDWAVKTPSNHGPGWYLWDDQSTATSNPYIVICNQSSPTANSKAIFIKVTVDSSVERVYFEWYLYWNNSSHAGLNSVSTTITYVVTQTGSFAYYFRGGDDIIKVFSRIGSSITYARLSKGTGLWDGSTLKFLEPESTSGVLVNPAYLITDPGGYISNYQNLTGVTANLDANGKLYFNIVVSGSNYTINIYKDSARTQLIGHSGPWSGSSFLGTDGVTADNSSGLGGSLTGVLQPPSTVTNIDCRFHRLDLGTGQGTNFRLNKWYYLIDLSGSTAKVSYVKVLSKSGDQLVVDYVGKTFAAGAYISPYPHRWLIGGFNGSSSTSYLPYSSFQTAESQINNCVVVSDWMAATVARVNPDDEGDYVGQQPWIGESNGNRMYFYENEIVIGAAAGLNPLTDRRIINGIPYLCYLVNGTSWAALVRDLESLS